MRIREVWWSFTTILKCSLFSPFRLAGVKLKYNKRQPIKQSTAPNRKQSFWLIHTYQQFFTQSQAAQ